MVGVELKGMTRDMVCDFSLLEFQKLETINHRPLQDDRSLAR